MAFFYPLNSIQSWNNNNKLTILWPALPQVMMTSFDYLSRAQGRRVLRLFFTSARDFGLCFFRGLAKKFRHLLGKTNFFLPPFSHTVSKTLLGCRLLRFRYDLKLRQPRLLFTGAMINRLWKHSSNCFYCTILNIPRLFDPLQGTISFLHHYKTIAFLSCFSRICKHAK